MDKDFLSMRDLSASEMEELFALAADMKSNPAAYAGVLKGKALALIFEKPSLRTRVSFDVGIHQLGGFSVTLLPQEISLGKRESVYDVAKNLERMVQGIMVRTFAHQVVVDLARHASVPVINGLSDSSHPCQALADYFTMRELKGALQGLRVAYVGDGNNVCRSLMEGAARLGIHLTMACPKGFELDAGSIELAQREAAGSGATLAVTDSAAEAVEGADVVYTDVWASMGQESEAEARRSVFKPFQVNEALMARAKPDALFMHCLPAHRGEEVTDGVIDGKWSVVFQQAENRLHVQKAILHRLMQ